MSQKKSQAAFEFLVTYGWAIFGVLMVLAGLAYFGFFNTQKFVNDACNFGDQIRCEDYILYGKTANLSMTFRNNFGVNIDVTQMVVNSDYRKDVVCVVNPSINIPAGRLFNASCTLYNSEIIDTEKVKINGVIVFNRNGGTSSHNQTGSIVVTSQS